MEKLTKEYRIGEVKIHDYIWINNSKEEIKRKQIKIKKVVKHINKMAFIM